MSPLASSKCLRESRIFRGLLAADFLAVRWKKYACFVVMKPSWICMCKSSAGNKVPGDDAGLISGRSLLHQPRASHSHVKRVRDKRHRSHPSYVRS